MTDSNIAHPDVQAYIVVVVIVCLVTTFCSSILLAIVYNLDTWNDYTTLIFSMTLGQLVYDVCFIHHVTYLLGDDWFITSVFLDLIGIAGAYTCYVLSNIISFSVVYMLIKRAVFNITKYKLLFATLIVAPILMLVIFGIYYAIEALSGNEYTYTLDVIIQSFVYIRMAPIVLNVIFMVICWYYTQRYSKLGLQSVHEKSISVLVGRLKWYPIIQILNRVFPFWYDIQYPNYEDDGYSSDILYQYVLNMLGVISPIIAPVGFLIVYLYMYPKIYSQVKSRMNSAVSTLNSGMSWFSTSSNNSSSFAFEESSSRKSNTTSDKNSSSTSTVVISEFRDSTKDAMDFNIHTNTTTSNNTTATTNMNTNINRDSNKEYKNRESNDSREHSGFNQINTYKEVLQKRGSLRNTLSGGHDLSHITISDINWENMDDQDLVLIIGDDSLVNVKTTQSVNLELNSSHQSPHTNNPLRLSRFM